MSKGLYPPLFCRQTLTTELHQSLVCFMEKSLKRKHPLKGVQQLTPYAEYELCRGCFSRNFPKIFKTAFPKNTSDKIILLKDSVIIVSFISQIIKICLNLLSGQEEDLINQLVASTTKMQRYMGKQTPRGDDLVITTVRASIQTQKKQVFFEKNPSTEP